MVAIKIGVLITKNDRLLLIKEWSEKKDKYCWNIITGKYELEKDKTIADCAKREVKEEIGIDVSLTQILEIRFMRKHGPALGIAYIAKPQTEKDNPFKNEESITEIKWFTKQEIEKLTPDELMAKNICGVLEKWRKGEYYPLSILDEAV